MQHTLILLTAQARPPAQERDRPDLVAGDTAIERRAARWLRTKACALSCHTTHAFLVTGGRGRVARSIRRAVANRVRGWAAARPWYRSQRAGSRGTEAVLNALALTNLHGPQAVSRPADRRRALRNLVAEQQPDGAWAWLAFNQGPWESSSSRYFGATLAALVLGPAETTHPAARRKLRAFLRAGLPSATLHDRALMLWAGSRWPGLLETAERATLIAALEGAQRADGGWRLADLGPWTPPGGRPPVSDGYATGLVVLALVHAHLPANGPAVTKGLAWLSRHQRADGTWPGYTLNNPGRDGKMTDAATAFALAALRAGGTSGD